MTVPPYAEDVRDWLRSVLSPMLPMGVLAIQMSPDSFGMKYEIQVPDSQVGLLVGTQGRTARSIGTLAVAYLRSKNVRNVQILVFVKNPSMPPHGSLEDQAARLLMEQADVDLEVATLCVRDVLSRADLKARALEMGGPAGIVAVAIDEWEFVDDDG